MLNDMKRNLLIASAGMLLVLALILLAVLWIRSQAVTESEIPLGSSGSVFPTGTSVGDSAELVPTKTIATLEDGTIAVKDFISNGETIPDVVNPGSFVLAGDLGYCLYDGTCPQAADTPSFNIRYEEKTQAFTVTLLAEPLGTTRLAAESFLIDRLGIEARDLCRIRYYLGVPNSVNSVYTGDNLGFSFCPGATKLP